MCARVRWLGMPNPDRLETTSQKKYQRFIDAWGGLEERKTRTHRETQRHRGTQRETMRHRGTQRATEDTERHRERDTERHRETQRHTERQRQMHENAHLLSSGWS